MELYPQEPLVSILSLPTGRHTHTPCTEMRHLSSDAHTSRSTIHVNRATLIWS